MTTEPQVTLSHDEAARDMIVRIMAIVTERLPHLTGRTAGELRRVAGVAAVPDDFFEQVAVAVDASPAVGDFHGITSEESRDMIVWSRVYENFADQVIQLGKSIHGVVTERRYDVAQRALAVYGSIKSANRTNSKPAVSNAASLRRALGRSGGRRKATAVQAPDTGIAAKK